jgi:hypothetical protein
MTEKVEFASPAWMERFGDLLVSYMATTPDPPGDFSLCEIFTDAPAHLGADASGRVAWHCHIRGRTVTFGLGELPDADLTICGEYDFIVKLARWIHRPETAEAYERLRQAGAAEGRVSTTGDRSRVLFMRDLHNQIAELTL